MLSQLRPDQEIERSLIALESNLFTLSQVKLDNSQAILYFSFLNTHTLDLLIPIPEPLFRMLTYLFTPVS